MCAYSWRVPKDLRLSGGKEVFAIAVTYDTQELYGKVRATRNITITSEAAEGGE